VRFIRVDFISLFFSLSFLDVLQAQNITFSPESDTILVVDGCSGSIIRCSLNSDNTLDSIIISPGFNSFLLAYNNSGQWQDIDKCYFLVQDTSDQYDYELWYTPQGVLPYFQQVPFDSSFETLARHFFLTLVVKSQENAVDSLSQQFKTEYGLGIPDDQKILPATVQLYPNYPNPFNATTTIPYYLPGSAIVDVLIYNISGQLMTSLIRAKQTTGNYSVKWNANQLSLGIYFIYLEIDNFRIVQKCILAK
jgi:hypothetical protein